MLIAYVHSCQHKEGGSLEGGTSQTSSLGEFIGTMPALYLDKDRTCVGVFR